ncbi:MAG: hypothetical protein Q8R08_00910, partial [bacterium]|nr:hypothetical protein [bacterium]
NMPIDETQVKTVLKQQREEYQRYLGAALEGVDKSIKAVGEGQTVLHEKVDKLQTQFDNVTEDIAIIKMDIEFIKAGLKRKVDVDEFTALEKRVAVLEHKR